ncbi:MAG TPA: hypothetical protein VJT49_05135 [Amycolatopsis sp.]|uniref:hypothetical protein n=1 Tax=Amycolatopsis sp. TaxID=37632 RepID=UPI002B48EA96|nr:hypothetical protein [Amycolatopsis sp.]HKS44491.1 hypothetical protein [Amycolatopsis sp.]
MKGNRLSPSVLDVEKVELLPTRNALSGFDIDVVVPINIAIAIAGDDATAVAGQFVDVD